MEFQCRIQVCNEPPNLWKKKKNHHSTKKWFVESKIIFLALREEFLSRKNTEYQEDKMTEFEPRIS